MPATIKLCASLLVTRRESSNRNYHCNNNFYSVIFIFNFHLDTMFVIRTVTITLFAVRSPLAPLHAHVIKPKNVCLYQNRQLIIRTITTNYEIYCRYCSVYEEYKRVIEFMRTDKLNFLRGQIPVHRYPNTRYIPCQI